MPSVRRCLLLAGLLLLPLALAGCAEKPSNEAAKVCTSTTDEGASAAEPVVTFRTSLGDMRIKLFCDKAPLTAQNFVAHVESGNYDGTRFHRVIPDFMNQGGDPLSKDLENIRAWGTGGDPAQGDALVDEFYCADGYISNEHPAQCGSHGGLGLLHDKAGVLSMANTGRPRTGGSQFFITTVPTPWLDGKHAIFGELADAQSLEVALAINQRATPPQGDPSFDYVMLEDASVEWS